jgi:hypothetical protein
VIIREGDIRALQLPQHACRYSSINQLHVPHQPQFEFKLSATDIPSWPRVSTSPPQSTLATTSPIRVHAGSRRRNNQGAVLVGCCGARY